MQPWGLNVSNWYKNWQTIIIFPNTASSPSAHRLYNYMCAAAQLVSCASLRTGDREGREGEISESGEIYRPAGAYQTIQEGKQADLVGLSKS